MLTENLHPGDSSPRLRRNLNYQWCSGKCDSGFRGRRWTLWILIGRLRIWLFLFGERGLHHNCSQISTSQHPHTRPVSHTQTYPLSSLTWHIPSKSHYYSTISQASKPRHIWVCSLQKLKWLERYRCPKEGQWGLRVPCGNEMCGSVRNRKRRGKWDLQTSCHTRWGRACSRQRRLDLK